MRVSFKNRRKKWVEALAGLSGDFGDDATRMATKLRGEIESEGGDALLDHLRMCGSVPEAYGHDSSEEKLYSKYTDAIVCESLRFIGLKSTLISARADAADVQARGSNYSLVADAKAFRLSRTAKNQKDFKIQAMDGWRGELDFSVVICPIYQVPGRTSQIYQQAIAHNVCILSFSHLAALTRLSMTAEPQRAEYGLGEVLRVIPTLSPSKSAVDYWMAVNRVLVGVLGKDLAIWTEERRLSMWAFEAGRLESLLFLRTERDRLLGLSHEQALTELLRRSGLESRIRQVEFASHGDLLGE